jgi:hypothetical protein
MAKQRKRVKHTATFEERLGEEAIKFKDAAEKQPPGSTARELLLRRARCKVADQRRFGGIGPELLQRGLIVLHLRSPALLLLIGSPIFHCLGRGWG